MSLPTISSLMFRRCLTGPAGASLLQSGGSAFKSPAAAAQWFLLRSCSSGGDIASRIDSLVKSSDVVVFMKGVPDAPRCGFSNAVCQIMRMHDVPFEAHNVLDDEQLRQGIKDFSNWPTIPQIYFKGEFIGGCDIMLQMHQSGELVEELQKIGITSALVKEDQDKK